MVPDSVPGRGGSFSPAFSEIVGEVLFDGLTVLFRRHVVPALPEFVAKLQGKGVPHEVWWGLRAVLGVARSGWGSASTRFCTSILALSRVCSAFFLASLAWAWAARAWRRHPDCHREPGFIQSFKTWTLMGRQGTPSFSHAFFSSSCKSASNSSRLLACPTSRRRRLPHPAWR